MVNSGNGSSFLFWKIKRRDINVMKGEVGGRSG